MADHTSGGAAATLLEEPRSVLTVEFKISYLRPARGERLRCVSTLIKPGKRLVVAETDVFALANEEAPVHTARAIGTLALGQPSH